MSLNFIDAHVHIHECYNLNEYLNLVFYNFSKSAESADKNWNGFLLLSEINEVNFFNKIFQNNSIINSNNFKIVKTSEEVSIIVENKNKQKIILITGKQVIAENGIEVLALCTNKEFENGRSLENTIDEINKIGGVPVIPWGVGKWLGKKGKLLKSFIENSSDIFFLGDNSGRPVFWHEPKIFKLGKVKKHFVLSGTDSLPIASEQNKTASYGFILDSEIDTNYPAKELKRLIFNLDHQPDTFGKLESPVRFVKNQILMQIHKRKK